MAVYTFFIYNNKKNHVYQFSAFSSTSLFQFINTYLNQVNLKFNGNVVILTMVSHYTVFLAGFMDLIFNFIQW